MKVLQVSAFFPLHGGGIEVVAGQLAHAMAAAGVDVHWMAGGTPSELPASLAGEHLRLTQARSIDLLERRIGLPAPIWSAASVAALWRAVGEVDVVHVHDYLYMPTLLAALFARLRGRPLVVTQHIGEIPFRSTFLRGLLGTLNHTLGALTLRSARQTVFVGRPVLEYFGRISALPIAPQLIPNGVDHLRFHPEDRTLPATAREVELLFVGRFVEKKGLRLLNHCIDLPGARWTFVGWGPMPPVQPEHGRVRIPGRLAPADIAPLYQAADLLVLPSTGEGFPLVVQEALACGTPVLVSSEVAAAFPASDPRCVFEVELRCSDPVAALKDALSRLVADPSRLAAARAPAGELAKQWSWEHCVNAYRAVYDRVRRNP